MDTMFEPGTFLVIWVLFAVCIGGFADFRGRSAFKYGALAFFFSPAVAMIVLLTTPNLAAGESAAGALNEGEESRQSAVKVQAPARFVADELEKLAALRDKGVLTDTEFSQLKMQLLPSKE